MPTPTASPITATPTPIGQGTNRSIDQSVVHVIGDGGTGSGFIINDRGDIIANAHIIDRTFKVNIWLPEGRMLGGMAEATDKNTDLALIRIREIPEGLALEPIQLGSSERVTYGDPLVAVSMSVGDSTASGIRGYVRGRLISLDGAEWIRMDALPEPGSIGGPVLRDPSGEVVGMTVRQRLAGDVGTYVLASEYLRERIDFLVDRADNVPIPAATAVPSSSIAIGKGWTFFSSECRPEWANCEYSTWDDYIQVVAYAHSAQSDVTGELPDLEIFCRDDGSLGAHFHPKGLSFNENDSGIVVGVWLDGVERTGWITVAAFQFPFSRAFIDGTAIVKLLNEAEISGKTIEIGSLSYEGRAIGVFDPNGFRTNYWRLPCAR